MDYPTLEQGIINRITWKEITNSNNYCVPTSSVQYEPPVKKSDAKKRIKGVNSQAKSAERVGDKRDGWSQEEESLLETGVMEFGNNWTLILYK